MKVISIVGARPQFIKVAPLIWAIEKHNAEIHTKTQNQNPDANLNLNSDLNDLPATPVITARGKTYVLGRVSNGQDDGSSVLGARSTMRMRETQYCLRWLRRALAPLGFEHGIRNE